MNWKSLVFVLLLLPLVMADINSVIPLQGRLVNASGSVMTGTFNMSFSLYLASSGGTAIYTENVTTNITAGNGIRVADGLFEHLIGSNTSLATVNFTSPMYLEIQVGQGNSLQTLSPRMTLGASPFAFAAKSLITTTAINESVVSINKTGTGGGAVISVTQNSGTGADISTPNFNVTNGLVVSRFNQLGFAGNGSGLTALDAGALANGTVASGRLSGTYSGALVFSGANNNYTGNSYTGVYGRPSFAGNGSALEDLDANNIANGSLYGGGLSGTYSGALVFSGSTNNYTGQTATLTQPVNSDAITLTKTGTGTGSLLTMRNYGTASTLTAITTTNNDGVLFFKNSTGAGTGVNITNYGTGEALNIQESGNGDAVLIQKLATGAGDALQIENSGGGAALNIVGVGNGNATISTTTGNGHWADVPGGNTRLYANGTADAMHSGDGLRVANRAVNVDSIIIVMPNALCGATNGCEYAVTQRVNDIGFSINVTNGTSRSTTVDFGYIIVN